jgi:hypothetical protein
MYTYRNWDEIGTKERVLTPEGGGGGGWGIKENGLQIQEKNHFGLG